MVPLEELAAIFGDTDEVKAYATEIIVKDDGEVVQDDHHLSEKNIMKSKEMNVVLRERV
jgi:hypothetical protein